MKWCFFPPLLALGVWSWAGKYETGVLGASLAVSDWSVVVVSAHAGANVDTISQKTKASGGKKLNWPIQIHNLFGIFRREKIYDNILTTLPAACPVRHSFNGGDGLDSTSIHRHSDRSFGHDGLIHLNNIKIFNALFSKQMCFF